MPVVPKKYTKTVQVMVTDTQYNTLIKLKSGRLAIVTEQSSQTLLKPIIKIFYSTSSKSPIPNKIIDLSRSQETIESVEAPENWDFDRQHLFNILMN